MRVLLVSSFTPPLVGGLERIATTVAQSLVAAGHEAAIVGHFASARVPLRERFVRSEPERSFREGDIDIAIIRSRWMHGAAGLIVYAMIWISPLRRIAAALLARAFRKSLGPLASGADLVHYLGTGTETLGFAAADTARRAGAAFVVQPAIHPGRWGDRTLDAELYRRADTVLAFTQGEAEVICRLGVHKNCVRTVPGSIDPTPATDPDGFRRKYGITGPIVLFLGRKTEDKGVGHLLKAWPTIRAAFPSASLVFVGPAAETEFLRLARPKGVIDITDASNQEKHDALAACDLLCMPSVGESFGIAVFEAFSHGKPVVVADVPAMRESVGSTRSGLLVSPEPAAAAAGVIALLRDPATRSAMGERGRVMAATHTHDAALARYLEAYADALQWREATT